MATFDPRTPLAAEAVKGLVNEEAGELFDPYLLDDEQFIVALAAAKHLAKEYADIAGRLEMAGIDRALTKGATTLYGKDQNYVISQPNDYQRDRLHPLLELLNKEQVDECYTPKGWQQVWVKEDKWDMTKVKKHAKARGNEALAIVENATFPGRASGKLVEVES